MNKGITLSFKIVSIIRLIGIPLIFILEKLWSDSIPDTGFLSGMKIDIHFTFWEYLIIYGTLVIFLINTIAGLILSFKPQSSIGFLQKKNIWRILYFAEWLILPFLVFACYTQISDTFFRPEPGLLGEAINFLWPSQHNPNTDLYEQLRVIDFCMLACCSIFFISFFWKVYNSSKD